MKNTDNERTGHVEVFDEHGQVHQVDVYETVDKSTLRDFDPEAKNGGMPRFMLGDLKLEHISGSEFEDISGKKYRLKG